MSKYGEVARLAAEDARNGAAPRQAWQDAAQTKFPNQSAGRDKGCPRDAFLGLAEDGLIVGVPSGQYTKSKLNKRYATRAVGLLRQKPDLANTPRELWCLVMSTERDINKTHNHQMDVVTALWSAGDIRPSTAS